MMLASGTHQWWWRVLLASGVNSAGQWCWPVVLPSVAVHFAGQLGQLIARRARSCTHMFECIVNSSSPFITITTIITIRCCCGSCGGAGV
jgi:hypothetical protein